MTRTRVLGVGSPHGDDQVGWRFVELLRRKELPNTEVEAVQGGISLLDSLQDCQTAILIDACQSGAPPGTVSRLEWPDARITAVHHRTTHGFSVGSALALAEQLGRLPQRVVVYGVEMEHGEPGAAVSRAVEATLPELARRVLDELLAGTRACENKTPLPTEQNGDRG